MSELSYLEKLLDGVGVEWLPLKNVAEVRSGWGFPNAYQGKSKGDYPFYKVSDMNIIGNETVMSTANNFISNEVADKLGIRLAPAGTIIFPKIGAAIATNKKRLLFMPSAYDNNVMGLVTNEKVISRYVFYWMQTINLSTLANDSGAVPSIRKSEIEALLFPIPCPHNPEKSLAVQSEIVRILDKFTILTAELTAKLTTELIARKKQYNYYRDQLLSFDEDGVEWKTLGELAEINTGQKPPEILESATTFDYINAGTTRSGYTTISNCDGDTVTTPSRGQGGIGFVGYQKMPFWLGPLCYKMRAIDERVLNNKFLFYFLRSRSELLLSLKKEGGVPALNKSDLVKLTIPLPSMDKQKRIIAMLDKFDTLTYSINKALSREIELRQKQYGYYQDLLFSFPNPDAKDVV
ncbi:restriction endonuclease subunit S [Klebsiella pneumoniae]|uniref:restriction endonuclease subunit S n=1 Tax=Klebsiella pneumoniae TaxID=573 RepID=UPI001EB48EEE|nr:restriction endonuclease subunit S [Klebsiella pneumoniae]MBK3269651.1 restriction endonuclease subunit S [Klebsiella pneumoniae]MBK3279930.1 restriction endonuclease subunit S [Klebsiella pneumoniae]